MMSRNEVHPSVFPCGHVQLIGGAEGTLVELKEAFRYCEELRTALLREFPEFANLADRRVREVQYESFADTLVITTEGDELPREMLEPIWHQVMERRKKVGRILTIEDIADLLPPVSPPAS